MLMIDKDKAITTVMGRRRHADGSVSEAPMKPSEMKAEGGEIDPRHEAAKDILAAIHEKHPGKLVEAMHSFHELHQLMHDGKEKEEEKEA